MRQKILGAWQTWRAKAEEPDCGRDAPPAQAAHLKRGHAAETLAATYLQGHGLQAHCAEGAGETLDGVGPAGGCGPVVPGEGIGDGLSGVFFGGDEVAQQGGVEIDVAFHATEPGGRVEAVDGMRKGLRWRHVFLFQIPCLLQRGSGRHHGRPGIRCGRAAARGL